MNIFDVIESLINGLAGLVKFIFHIALCGVVLTAIWLGFNHIQEEHGLLTAIVVLMLFLFAFQDDRK